MRVLELFSGTGSIGNVFKERGWEVVSVDIDNRFGCTICEDILQLSYCKLETPDVIWASCPCVEYSRARTTGPPRNFLLADSLVEKTIEIIKYFEKLNPRLIWFIENGHTTMLWERDVARNLTDYTVVDYCCFGALYRKRTRLAHSKGLIWDPPELCDKNTCHACVNKRRIRTAQRGNSKHTGKEDRFNVDQLHTLF